jgi:hypothetical protein
MDELGDCGDGYKSDNCGSAQAMPPAVAPPSPAQLLAAWQGAFSMPLPHRALRLLAVADTGLRYDELAALPIGRRDARLMQLRQRLFGSPLLLAARCPQCQQTIDSALPAASFGADPARPAHRSAPLASHGYRVRFRLPASDDLIAIGTGCELARARELLLGRCILDARDAQGAATRGACLPPAVLADLAARIGAADPSALLELGFECSACAHQWRDIFDIAAFLWQEVDAWGQRTLRDLPGPVCALRRRQGDAPWLRPERPRAQLIASCLVPLPAMNERPGAVPMDFFAHMAHKARGADSTIAPRLPS